MASGRASAASLHHPADYRVGDADLDGKNASDYSIPRSILSDLALAECESLYDTAALTSKQPWGHSFPGNLLLLLLLLYLIRPALERGGYLNFNSFFATFASNGPRRCKGWKDGKGVQEENRIWSRYCRCLRGDRILVQEGRFQKCRTLEFVDILVPPV